MSNDLTYGVSVEYLSSGNLGLPGGASGVNKVTDSFKSLQSGISSVNGMLDSVIGGIWNLGAASVNVVSTALAGGFALALQQSIKFNQEMEDTQTGLATLATAAEGIQRGMTPQESFGNQYRVAGDVIKQMRKDAQELPGSFADLQRIMVDLAPAGETSGMGQFAIEAMAAKAMAAGSAMGPHMPKGQIGRQLGEMLSGAANVRNSMFRNLHTGYSAKEFNKLDEKERLHVTQNALDKMQAGKESAKQNWSTISSNFVDSLKIGVGVVGGPLMGRVKEVMKEFNDSDKGRFGKIGARIGDGLVQAFDRGLELFKRYLPVAQTFVTSMYNGIKRMVDQFSPIIEMLGTMVTNFFNDPMVFHKIEKIIGQLIALKAGASVVEVGAGAGSSLMRMGSTAGLGMAEMGPAAIALGIAIAAAAVAVEGFTSALTDSQSAMHGAAVQSASVVAAAGARLGRELTDSGSVFKQGSELLGIAASRSAEWVVGGIADLAHQFNILADASYSLNRFWLGLAGKGILDKNGADIADDAHGRTVELANDIFAANPFIKTMDAFANPEKATAAKPPQHTTNIHKVEINVNSNQDPSRIAKATVGLIREMARNPKSAAINPSGRFSIQQ